MPKGIYVRDRAFRDNLRDKLRHTAFREQVKEIRIKNPCLTLEQIGERTGVSRERVRQILAEEGLPTKHQGERIGSKGRKIISCLNCGRPTPNNKYCSIPCQWIYTHPLVECHQCHKLFRKAQTDILRKGMEHKYYFCNRKCLGHWLAENYGWGAFPEHGKYPENEGRKEPEQKEEPAYCPRCGKLLNNAEISCDRCYLVDAIDNH